MFDPAQQTSQTGESILAVIGGLARVSGFMGVKRKPCALILTEHRIILAGLSAGKIRELVGQARDAAKLEGKGLLGQWGAQMRASSTYQQHYWEMTPDAILAEEPDNFAIPRAFVKKLKFKRGLLDDTGIRNPDRLTIHTTQEKLKFDLGDTLGRVKETFRNAGYPA